MPEEERRNRVKSPRPDDAVTCHLCGRRYIYLGTHLRRRHGISAAEYKLQFPGAPTTSPSYVEYASSQTRERLHGIDEKKGGPAAHVTCAKGHKLNGANLGWRPGGRKRCKRCARIEARKRRKRGYRRLCACGCGKRVKRAGARWLPNHHNKRKPGDAERICLQCGTPFTLERPSSKTLHCSKSCAAKTRHENEPELSRGLIPYRFEKVAQ